MTKFCRLFPQGTTNLASDNLHKTERKRRNHVLRFAGGKREAAGHTTQAHLCLATSLQMASEKRYVD
jgi:hypothetical protein